MKITYLLFLLLLIHCPGRVLHAAPRQSATFTPKIISVGSANIKVVTNRNGDEQTYSFTPATDIRVNGLKAAATELKAGMEVDVKMGMDRSVAASIVASEQGPAAPTPKPGTEKPMKKDSKDKKGATTFKPAFAKISSSVVVAVTGDKITIAPRGGKAVSYMVTPSTVVKINGHGGDFGDVQVGMEVKIAASGQSSAGRIEVFDAKK